MASLPDMPKRSSKKPPTDVNENALRVVRIATGEEEAPPERILRPTFRPISLAPRAQRR